MNRDFLELMMEKTGFPQEAKTELLRCADSLAASGQEAALDGAVEFFYENELSLPLTSPLILDIGERASVSPYTVWLLFLIEAAVPTREAYAQAGLSEEIFWNTFQDLKYKLLECREVQGVWGNFVSFWYPIFYTCNIFKLGRLEYENTTYAWEEPYIKNGYAIKHGDPVKSVHIPSSGEPFEEAARLASYRLAYEFFREELNGGPLVCVCDSWLLYPDYQQILSPSSNILSFQKDFDVISSRTEEEFHDIWRVFGGDYQRPLSQLPEKTSMQRAFKEYLLQGKKTGEGFGVLIFDGEKICNR